MLVTIGTSKIKECYGMPRRHEQDLIFSHNTP